MLQPYFLETQQGHIFIQTFSPIDATADAVIFVPPFAEEMNKSRRMMALLGHALSANGILMAVPDLYGTGDSEGSFAEASWGIWLANIHQLIQKLQLQGIKTISLVGLRMGCLLISDYLSQQQVSVKQVVLWKPVLSGQQMLNQFLRLRIANSIMDGKKETSQTLRALLASEGEIEVAGYRISARLVAGLCEKKTTVENFYKATADWHWFEVLANENQPVPMASARLIKDLKQRGMDVHLQTVLGESFWINQEISEIPALVNHTVVSLCSN